MLISRKWLEQYMDISDLSMEEIADKVTRAGFEVEAMYPMSQGTNLVIGEVLTCEPHPDSDHLNCTTVNVGDAVLDIVCGAPNVAAGQKVIVARVGAQLPDGEIKAGELGIVGEYGPELIQGPATVTSRKDTADILNRNQSNIIVNLIEDNEKAGTVTENATDEETIIDIFVSNIRRGGSISGTLESTYNLRRYGV